jgi:CheY-like chemotaxis protein
VDPADFLAGELDSLRVLVPAHEKISAKTVEKLRGKRILLVEDNEINQMVATEMLQQMGMQVSVASSGEQAVEMAVSSSFDAILMDINMPGMDGYQATAQIRNTTRSKSAQLPIIAMTAYALAGDDQKVLRAGLNDYVSKPVHVVQLANVLMHWLEHPDVFSDAHVGAEREPIPPAPGALDMVSALARLDNNKELYHRLLLMFHADHTLDAQAIRAALQNNDSELARRLAHTLKGLAGTIGADELRAVAKQLESVILEANESLYDENLVLLEQKLMAVMAAIAMTPALT